MVLWLILIVLTGAVVLAVAWPLLRQPSNDTDVAAADAARMNVYRDQQAEIDRDLARDVIGDEEAAAARLELSRRLLAQTAEVNRVPLPAQPHMARVTRVGIIATIPAIAVALYVTHGVPGLPGQPREPQAAVALTKASAGVPDVNQLIAQVEARLRSTPEDGRGWDVIAPVYLRDQRFTDARMAYARAIRLLGETPQRLLGLAESSVRAADGRVTDEARAVYEKIMIVEPERIEPRFWLAVAREQRGELMAAADDYRALLKLAPIDAPWRSAVIERLATLAPETPSNPSRTQPTRGPSADEAAAASSMTQEARQQMIGGMVEGLHSRLKANGQDAAGWQRLLRSYAVLGDVAKANAALIEARRALANDKSGLSAVDALAREIGLGS